MSLRQTVVSLCSILLTCAFFIGLIGLIYWFVWNFAGVPLVGLKEVSVVNALAVATFAYFAHVLFNFYLNKYLSYKSNKAFLEVIKHAQIAQEDNDEQPESAN